MTTRALLCGVLSIGAALTTACGSDNRASEARNFGTMTIPLETTVGANTYRLDAVFVITGAQANLTLTTSAAEPTLSTTLATGSYSASLQSFTLYKEEGGTGIFDPVPATPVSNSEPFVVFSDSTTTVNFQFETNGITLPLGTGNVNVTFGVTETPGQCSVLGPGCPDGYWCAPPALTGAPAACLLGGTTPIGAACTSPLECVAPSTCHDFGAGPVCTSLCSPDQFGQPCATGGSCVEADPSYGLCTPETACNPISVDRVARTVQSERFFLDFSNVVASNPEDLDVLKWAGAAQSGSAGDFGPNLTESFALDACSAGNVAFFGNSLVPPDVDRGGQVLVGAGSTGTWEQDGPSIVIHSKSSGCAQSVPADIETRYTFREDAGADTIEVERSFDFGSTPLTHPFRPFVPRLDHGNFDQVLHPDATGTTLVTEAVSNCPYGCQLGNWDGSWFAYYASSGSDAGLGMILVRAPSALPASLWVDYDGGFADTNSSSALLFGSIPSQVTEKELLCFFNAETWTPSLTLPAGCTLDLECKAETPAVGCDPNPCQHGGTCTPDGSGGHTCQCPATITGNDCEIVFTDVQVGQGFTCGLRNDGRILCWGDGFGGSGVPTGTFRALSAWGLAACALRTDGTIACWGYSNQGILSPPSGSFETIVTNSDYACATHDQIPTCWGSFAAYGSPPNDRFSIIELGGQYSCGIHPDGTVACWGNPVSDDGQMNPPADTFRALSLSSNESCGIRQSDSVLDCWGADLFGGAPLPTGALQAVDITGGLSTGGFGCAIDVDGRIICWGTTYPAPPAGSFKTLTSYVGHECAIGTDDIVTCWGQNAIDYGTPPY